MQRSSPQPSPRSQPPSATILIVDDHPSICELLALFLRARNYLVLIAYDGHEALQVAREGYHVDLLLTDIEMPGMQGDELADRFRALSPKTKVVYMSGSPYQTARFGHADFIAKPFGSPDELDARLREVLNRPTTASWSHHLAQSA